MKRVQETGGPPPGASHSEAVCALRVASSSYQEPTAGVGDVASMDLYYLCQAWLVKVWICRLI